MRGEGGEELPFELLLTEGTSLSRQQQVAAAEFIWAPCVQLYLLAEAPRPPPPPAFRLIYKGAFGQPR
jgi:hypothetical protein